MLITWAQKFLICATFAQKTILILFTWMICCLNEMKSIPYGRQINWFALITSWWNSYFSFWFSLLSSHEVQRNEERERDRKSSIIITSDVFGMVQRTQCSKEPHIIPDRKHWRKRAPFYHHLLFKGLANLFWSEKKSYSSIS